MKNKKGLIQWVFIVIAALIIILFILLSKGVLGIGKAHSLTQPSSGYSQDKCPDMGVVVSGNVNIEDSAVFDLEPSIKNIDVTEVTASGRSLLKFGIEQFTYEVEAVDEITNQRLDVFKGSGELRGSDNEGISKPYSVDFIIPDRNCDRSIDDFNIKIKATLKGEDIGERAIYEKLIRVRDGRVIK